MLFALAIAVSVQDARPPVIVIPVPPPLVRTEVAPPAPPAPPQPDRSRADRPTATFAVRVSVGSDRLVDERLRVGSTFATINQTRVEALAGECPFVSASLSRQLSVSLRPDLGGPQARDRYRLDVRFSRPVQQGCESGTRGLQLDQQFTLLPGQSLTLTGDAGLRVELRRE